MPKKFINRDAFKDSCNRERALLLQESRYKTLLCRVCDSMDPQQSDAVVLLLEEILEKGTLSLSPQAVDISRQVSGIACTCGIAGVRARRTVTLVGTADWFELATRRANQSRRTHSAHMPLMWARFGTTNRRWRTPRIRVRASVSRIITRHVSPVPLIRMKNQRRVAIERIEKKKKQKKRQRKRREKKRRQLCGGETGNARQVRYRPNTLSARLELDEDNCLSARWRERCWTPSATC